MATAAKLLLSSIGPSPVHDAALVGLVGKPLGDIRVAYIENAYDVYDDQASLIEGRATLVRNGYTFELLDLRDWSDRSRRTPWPARDLRCALLTGGNPYYLRSARAAASRATCASVTDTPSSA